MEAASSDNNQTFTAYSAAVHKVICMVIAGIMGLLQLMNQQSSSISEAHKPTLMLCFCLLVFFYAFLRVREAIEAQLRPGFLMRLIGHTSHLFGGLASIVLISMVCTPFALVLLSLWFLWLSFVAYDTFHEIKITYSEAIRIFGAGSPNSSPV